MSELSADWPGRFMYEFSAHIKCLVQIRHSFKDALIQGAQIYQPKSDNPAVVAYRYQGSAHQVITVVNTDTAAQTTNLALKPGDGGSTWTDLLTGETFAASGTVLGGVTLNTDTGSLRILHRTA